MVRIFVRVRCPAFFGKIVDFPLCIMVVFIRRSPFLNMPPRIKVSVVVPAYNTAPYLEQNLNSLRQQSLKEIELIYVDDGSTDGTLEILHKHECEDKRITVLRQVHQTAGAARNAGIEIATGEYVICLDSDDFFESNMLESMYNKAHEEGLDLVVSRADQYIENACVFEPAPWLVNIPVFEKMKGRPFCPRKDLPEHIFGLVAGNPWTKMWRRAFVEKHGLRYQALMNANDTYFTYAGLFLADKVSYVDNVMVHWRVRKDSLTSGFVKHPTCFITALCALVELVKNHQDGKSVWASLMHLCIDITTWRYERTHPSSRSIIQIGLRKDFEPRVHILSFIQSQTSNPGRTQISKYKKYIKSLGIGALASYIIPLDLKRKRSWCLLRRLPDKLKPLTNAIVLITSIHPHDEAKLAELRSSLQDIVLIRYYDKQHLASECETARKHLGNTAVIPGIFFLSILSPQQYEQSLLEEGNWKALTPMQMFFLKHFDYPWKY